MTDDRWTRVRDVFDAARELPAADRAAFLDRELAHDDPATRAEVEALLQAESAGHRFLAAAPGSFLVPESIGPYRVLERLGEGGFGVVHRAEQLQPISRQVALKLIKPGMDTKETIARFRAERQALALMAHPSIARVFDVGETDAGRPYFAMELVEGLPITKFCDEQRMSLRERIELFLEVCGAVQHAHQKGVIHRDLKASNVLVGRRDGAPDLKVIDFGIAKAMSAGLAERTIATQIGSVLGTLGSMSPEQAGAIEAAVDTRTDIYSLGVLLYELLAGEPPFDSKRLRSMAWTDAIRVIREEDPPRLPARLEASPAREEIAAHRRTDARGLARSLRGDLEWITQRALEKEPDRRYPSVSELAADLHRHLANETVLAGAPSRRQRLRKYVRRHRVGVAAATAVSVALLAGGIATGVALHRALDAERVARREADSARRVTDFMLELFGMATPDRSLGQTVTARTLLDVGARRIRSEAIRDEGVRGRLLSALGSAYASLGMSDDAMTLTRDATDAAAHAFGPTSVEYSRSLATLAELERATGPGEEVDSLLTRSTSFLDPKREGDRGALAAATLTRAEWRLNKGDSEAADSLAGAVVGWLESEARPDSALMVKAYTVRASVAGAKYALDEQEQFLDRALKLAVALYGERHSTVLRIHRSFTRLALFKGDGASAVSHADAAWEIAQSMYPPGHPSLANAMIGRGEALLAAERWKEAIQPLEEGIAMLRAATGGKSPAIMTSLAILARAYAAAGNGDRAVQCMEESVRLHEAAYGPESPRTAEYRTVLAEFLVDAGRRPEAEAIYRRAIPHLDPGRPIRIGHATQSLGRLLRDRGRFGEADSLFRHAQAFYDTTSSEVRPYFGLCLVDHAASLSKQGRHADAERRMEEGVRWIRKDAKPPSDDMQRGLLEWARARARAGRTDLAVETMREAVQWGATTAAFDQSPELAALRGRVEPPASSSH